MGGGAEGTGVVSEPRGPFDFGPAPVGLGRRPYEGIATFYAQYRPSWPEAVFTTLAARFRLDGTGRALDLGCGTGNLVLPLARYVVEAVGVDPEPHMLAEARAAAVRGGVSNVRWLQARAEDLADAGLRDPLGQFRLVMMGAAFHWMDRERVLAATHEMVAPGGGLAIVEGESPKTGFRRVVDETLGEWLGAHRRHPARPAQERRHGDLVARSPFGQPETVSLSYRLVWDVGRIIGWVYSFSHGAYVHLGTRRPDFEQVLRERLFGIEPTGVFTEDMRVELILAWKH